MYNHTINDIMGAKPVSRKQDNIFRDSEKNASKKRKTIYLVCGVVCLLCIALDIYFLIQIF